MYFKCLLIFQKYFLVLCKLIMMMIINIYYMFSVCTAYNCLCLNSIYNI